MIALETLIASYFYLSKKIFFTFLACVLSGWSLSYEITEVQQDSIVLFKYDLKYVGSSTTMDPNYKFVMDYLIDVLEDNPSITIHIRGHVCCGPNKKISRKRARKVYWYLKKRNIARERMSFAGYSDEVPLVYPEKTEEDEIKNRRVDFLLNYNN